MGTVPTIAPNAIQAISILGVGQKPIFFVTLAGHPQGSIVVKGEVDQQDNEQPISIAWSSKLMKNVQNAQVNVKVMTPAEITELRRFINATFAGTSMEAMHGNKTYAWVKMLKIEQLSDLDLYVPNPGGIGTKEDASKISRAIATFMRQGIWFQLGQMTAVDLFNGNNDRFDTMGGWVNKGNIMFANNALIGLDTWSAADYSGPSNLARGSAYQTGLDILATKHSRLSYARTITASVGADLAAALKRTSNKSGAVSVYIKLHDGTPVPIQLDQLSTLYVDQSDEFERGLKAGADQLKAYLRNKIIQHHGQQTLESLHTFHNRNKGKLNGLKNKMGFGKTSSSLTAPSLTAINAQRPRSVPQGIIDRMAYLDWL